MAYRRVVTRVGSTDDHWYGSGVEATFSYRDGVVSLSGWYDEYGSIEPVRMSLAEFLQALGITMADCQAALGVPPARGRSATTTWTHQGE